MHTEHGPEELARVPAERSFSGRTMGEIIHAAYGIDFEGNPVEPKTHAELLAVGYTDKEINVSLKAALLQDTMESLASKIDGETFLPVETVWKAYAGEKKYSFLSPKDLLDEDGNVDLAKRRIYLSALMANEAEGQWLGPYRSAHPEAFNILYEINVGVTGEPAEEVSIMEAADTGINSILALHRRIELTDPTAPLGPSMVDSLPALYKIASQNKDTMGSTENLEDAGFVYAPDTRREAELNSQLRQDLQHLSPDTLSQIKTAMLEGMLENVMYDNVVDETRVTAIQDMDIAFDDADAFIDYLCGDPTPENLVPTPALREYFDTYRGADIATDAPIWFEAAKLAIPAELQDTLIELESTQRIYALNPEYFTVHQEAAGEPISIQLAIVESPSVERKLGRAVEKLFREPVYVADGSEGDTYKPADTITPTSKTVRCAAMYTKLGTDNPQLQEACDMVDFHPKKMNGIAFIGLLDLLATHQAVSAARADKL